MNPDMAMMYLDFVSERHRIWEQRQAGDPQPWTDDPILAGRKFTNVYRVLDPGSQFVFEMADDDPDEHTLMVRALLYRFTNRPEFWRTTRRVMGRWPAVADLDDGTLAEAWRVTKEVLGVQMFSGAYICMPNPGGKFTPGLDKLAATVMLARRVLHPVGSDYCWPELSKVTTLQERFQVLSGPHAMGGFMTQQVLTDWGYVFGPDQENTFVADGPGSRVGAKHLGLKPQDAFRWGRESIHGVTLEGRPPSLMDVQNCFCEFGKYVRFQNRLAPAVTKIYQPVHPGPQPTPVLPKHWR